MPNKLIKVSSLEGKCHDNCVNALKLNRDWKMLGLIQLLKPNGKIGQHKIFSYNGQDLILGHHFALYRAGKIYDPTYDIHCSLKSYYGQLVFPPIAFLNVVEYSEDSKDFYKPVSENDFKITTNRIMKVIEDITLTFSDSDKSFFSQVYGEFLSKQEFYTDILAK